jgi:hypothetical protein
VTGDDIMQLRRLGEVEPLPAEVAERTEMALRAEMALRVEVYGTTVGQPMRMPVQLARIGAELGAPSRQRTRRAWLGAAAAVVVGGAGGALLATQPGTPVPRLQVHGGAPTSVPTATPTGPVHAVTAAYVVDRLQRAVNLDATVLVTVSRAPDVITGQLVTTETWSSPTSHTTRSEVLDAAGNPTTGEVLTISAGTTTAIRVDYTNRTWSTTTYPFGSSTSASAPAPLPETPAQVAAALQAAARTGGVTVVGSAAADGRPAIELRRTVPADGTIPAGTETTWVDPGTYLPIREVDVLAYQSIVTDYRWLPDTPANQRLLTTAAAIPSGFTEVVPPAGTSPASSAVATIHVPATA